jgi:hypothetical protein
MDTRETIPEWAKQSTHWPESPRRIPELTRITKAEVIKIVGLKGATIVESVRPSSSAWFLIRCEGFKIYKGKSYPSEFERDMLYNGSSLLGCYRESFATSGFHVPIEKEKKVLNKAIATFLDKTAMNT